MTPTTELRASSSAVRAKITAFWSHTDNGLGFYLMLPYPPALNNLYATVRGRRVLSREGREYRKRVASACTGMRPLTGDVSVRMTVYRPRRSGDLDNTFKAVFDALKGSVFNDDKQVVRIEADRHDDKHNPRVVIVVTAAGGANGGRP